MLVIRSSETGEVVHCLNLRSSEVLMSPAEIKAMFESLVHSDLAHHFDVLQGTRAVVPASRMHGRGAEEHPAIENQRGSLAGLKVVEYPSSFHATRRKTQ